MISWLEICVIGSMVGLSLLIGVYFGICRTQGTVKDYILGGKKMAVFPVTISLVASQTSGVTMMGVPAEIYTYGTQYCSSVCAFVFVYFITTKFYLPVFYNLQVKSPYEYLEMRFNRKIRTLASFLFAVGLVIYLPVVMFVPALALNQMTGLSIPVVAYIVSFICVFYTSIGGLKAVVWTDTLQSVFTLGSSVLIIVLGFLKIGSISEVFRLNQEGGRLEFFNMNPSPFERTTFWSASVGTIALAIAQIAVHPGGVQRFNSVPTFNQAKAIMCWTTVVLVMVKSVVVTIGLILYATYYDCDPLASKRVTKGDQILPLYVSKLTQDYPGLTGLFVSGVLSAAFSSMSAAFNTVAGTIFEDFVVPYLLRGEKKTEAKQSLIIKIIVLLLGLLSPSLVFVVEQLGSVFQVALSFIGVANGALAGVFTLGMFFPRANSEGAMIGTVTSLLVMAFMVGGSQYYVAEGKLKFGGKRTSVEGCVSELLVYNNTMMNIETHSGPGTPTRADASVPQILQLSYLYYPMMGILVTLAVGLLGSYLTKPPSTKNLKPELFTPLVRPLLSSPVSTSKESEVVDTNL